MHTHTHTHIYICIYIRVEYMYVLSIIINIPFVCLCVHRVVIFKAFCSAVAQSYVNEAPTECIEHMYI